MSASHSWFKRLARRLTCSRVRIMIHQGNLAAGQALAVHESAQGCSDRNWRSRLRSRLFLWLSFIRLANWSPSAALCN